MPSKKKPTKKKAPKKAVKKASPKPATRKGTPSNARSTGRTRNTKATQTGAKRTTTVNRNKDARPKAVQPSNTRNRAKAKQATKQPIRKQASLASKTKKLQSETRRVATQIQRNIKATKKAAKQVRDAFGRFTKAIKKSTKKAAPKKASAKHATKQPATPTKAAKGTAKNPRRKSAANSKAAKTPTQASGTVRRNRGQGTGGEKRGRPKGAGKTARNRATTREQRETKQPKLKVKAGKESYKLQELASSKSKNLHTLLKKIQDNSDAIDALKQPDQLWAFQIYNRHSITPYESIYGMMEFLAASGGLVIAGQEDANLFTRISILTKGDVGESYEGNIAEFHREREERQAELREANKQLLKDAKESFGVKPSSGKRITKLDIIKAALAENEKLRADAAQKAVVKKVRKPKPTRKGGR